MEPTEITTSIGIVHVEAEGRDSFTIRSPHEYGEAWPYFYWLTLDRHGERWEFTSPPEYSRQPGENERASQVPMPPELVNELLALGNEWAAAHPEEFEKAACEEFDDHIFYIVHDTFDELTRICSDAQGHFRRILNDEPEFRNYASTPLRRRVQKEAQRLRVMRLQISGAAKAINMLAGRRPSGAENQNQGVA